MPPEPGLAREIKRIRRLEAADVIGWWEAASLIAALEDGKGGTVHMLAHLPLIDLQARYLQLLSWGEQAMHNAEVRLYRADRNWLVTAILDRVS